MKSFVLALCIFAIAVSAKKHKPHQKCGLPPFTPNLPDDIKEKVEKIWENYEVGANCTEQRDATQQIVDSLTPDQKIKALAPVNREAHGHRYRHRGGARFLQGVSKDVRSQFYALWKNRTLSRDEKVKAFDELANRTLEAEQLEEYKKFASEMKNREEVFQKRVENLSPEARGAYEKLNEIRQHKIRIYTDLSESARDELEKLFSRRYARVTRVSRKTKHN